MDRGTTCGAQSEIPQTRVSRRGRGAARRGSERGQALIEFALVVPMLALLVLGIFDFGQAYNFKNDETSLANQALRYAEVNACSVCSGTPIEDYVKTTADSSELKSGTSATFGVAQPGVTISFCLPQAGTTGAVGDPLEAKATATYRWLPFLNIGNVTITSTAIGRIEQAYNSASTSSNAYANGKDAGSVAPLGHSC
jgi:TadE-like protein